MQPRRKRQRVGDRPATSVGDLPHELLAMVCCQLPGLSDVRSASLARVALVGPARAAVRTLRASGRRSPPWDRFGKATGLLLRLDVWEPSSRPGIKRCLNQLADRLPSRLQRIICVAQAATAPPAPAMHPAIQGLQAFIARALAAPCAASLATINIAIPIPAASAELLLRAQLPQLQHLSLRTAATASEPIYSAFPPALQSLAIRSEEDFGLDAAALGRCCPQLSRLVLSSNRPGIICGSIASLAALQELELSYQRGGGRFEAVGAGDSLAAREAAEVIAATAQLKRLRSLRLRSATISSSTPQWQQLCGGAALQELELEQLHIDSVGAAPAPRIQLLDAECVAWQEGVVQPQQLAALLPGLRRLRLRGVSHWWQLLGSARGHPHLQELTLLASGAALLMWSPLHLGLAKLAKLHLQRISACSLDSVLAGAACCAQLQELHIGIVGLAADGGGGGAELGNAGLRALVRGACSGALRKLALQACDAQAGSGGAAPRAAPARYNAQDAALLLRGGLPALQELRLDVSTRGRQLRSGQRQAEAALAAAMAAGSGGDGGGRGRGAAAAAAPQPGALERMWRGKGGSAQGAWPAAASPWGEEPAAAERQPARWEQQQAELLQAQLAGHGVKGAHGFAVAGAPLVLAPERAAAAAVRGRVGGCELECRVWV
jgi:hypothetical protein